MKCPIVPLARITASPCRDAQTQEADPGGLRPSRALDGISARLVRGISRPDQDAALQGRIEHGRAYARCIGARASNPPISSRPAIDVHAVWRWPLDDACELGLLFNACSCAGNYVRGLARPHATEVRAGIGGPILLLKHSQAATRTIADADARHGGHVDACAKRESSSASVPDGPVGHPRIRSAGRASYADMKLRITRKLVDGFARALGTGALG